MKQLRCVDLSRLLLHVVLCDVEWIQPRQTPGLCSSLASDEIVSFPQSLARARARALTTNMHAWLCVCRRREQGIPAGVPQKSFNTWPEARGPADDTEGDDQIRNKLSAAGSGSEEQERVGQTWRQEDLVMSLLECEEEIARSGVCLGQLARARGHRPCPSQMWLTIISSLLASSAGFT